MYALLEQDALLAGEVMKLVHSPLYAGQAAAKTLQQALTRIGIKNLRDIVLQASLNMRVFRCDAYRGTMDRLRQHSAATGHLCRIVCRYTSLDAEYAFLCGLLHDVGIAAVLIALAESAAKTPPDLVAIWPSVERVHPLAAQKMAQLWQLPADIGLAIGAHHQVKIAGHAHPLAATVCVADQVAHERGLGLAEAGADDQSLDQACLASHFAIDHSGPATLAAGRSSKEISYSLGISGSAVANAIGSAVRKLGLQGGRAGLASFFARGGVRARLIEMDLAGEPVAVSVASTESEIAAHTRPPSARSPVTSCRAGPSPLSRNAAVPRCALSRRRSSRSTPSSAWARAWICGPDS